MLFQPFSCTGCVGLLEPCFLSVRAGQCVIPGMARLCPEPVPGASFLLREWAHVEDELGPPLLPKHQPGPAHGVILMIKYETIQEKL